MFPQGRCTRNSAGWGSPWAAAMASGYNPHGFVSAAVNAFGVAGESRGQPQPTRNGAPPASSSFIARLKPINVSSDDLLEVSNKECVVCLGEQRVGDQATKLACGHLFHGACLEEWLRLHATCPTCRYELETDDKVYEAERKSRMKDRKLRYRKVELLKKSIPELKDIMRTLDISPSGCFDKTDLIEKIALSGRVEIMDGLPPMELTMEALRSTPVSELRAILRSFYIEEEDVIEKGELVHRIVESGRVVIVEETSVAPTVNAEEGLSSNSGSDCLARGEDEGILDNEANVAAYSVEEYMYVPVSAVKQSLEEERVASGEDVRSNEAAVASSAYSSLGTSAQEADESESSDPRFHLMKMPVKELKSIASAFNVDVKQCIYKEDIVDRIIAAQLM